MESANGAKRWSGVVGSRSGGQDSSAHRQRGGHQGGVRRSGAVHGRDGHPSGSAQRGRGGLWDDPEPTDGRHPGIHLRRQLRSVAENAVPQR